MPREGALQQRYGYMEVIRLNDSDASLRLQDALPVHSAFCSTFSQAYPEERDEGSGYPQPTDYGGLSMNEDGRPLSQDQSMNIE